MRYVRWLAALALGSALLLTPMAARADGARTQREDIVITKNAGFTKANGVVSGRGTTKDPYVISGWDVHHIEIRDTSKAVRIENNSIRGQLVLNWIGDRVLVRTNDISDLRVNENVERTGAPTSGVIERNTFDVVGQLRHFDGKFIHNTVGYPRGSFLWQFDTQAVNFDGFNGAEFAYNTIYGYVDARLHGHHHSSGFGDDSHMHAGSSHEHEMVDHTKRWHEVFIHDNTITANNWYSLAYLDTAHSVNDRTATSETDEALEEPHVHRTRVHIMDNVLVGGGLLVDVFNAQDERHTKLLRGAFHIAGNSITLTKGQFHPFESRTGIEVWQARALRLHITDNVVDGIERSSGMFQPASAGIRLDDLERANVHLMGNRVTNQYYGIQAQRMAGSVHWMISDFATENVAEPVSYDESVANEPDRG